jgi:hypothetical protein
MSMSFPENIEVPRITSLHDKTPHTTPTRNITPSGHNFPNEARSDSAFSMMLLCALTISLLGYTLAVPDGMVPVAISSPLSSSEPKINNFIVTLCKAPSRRSNSSSQSDDKMLDVKEFARHQCLDDGMTAQRSVLQLSLYVQHMSSSSITSDQTNVQVASASATGVSVCRCVLVAGIGRLGSSV